jgi:Zinc-binding dehydrogenase
MPADRLVVLPDGVSDQQGAAMMLKGMTTQYLIRQIRKVGKGDVILIHAAAGGVGLIACQWAKALGATVIGTVGSDEKAKLAKANGCDHPIIYTREDFVERVKELTNGEKVAVVYDSIGKDTFLKSLDCLRPLGLMVCFGQASGPIGPVDLGIFVQKGSLFFTRPSLNTYAAKRADLVAMAQDLFDVVLAGKVKIKINQTYPLKEAASRPRRPQDDGLDGIHDLAAERRCHSACGPNADRRGNLLNDLGGKGSNSEAYSHYSAFTSIRIASSMSAHHPSPVHRRSRPIGLQTARSSRTHRREVGGSNRLSSTTQLMDIA